MQRKYFIGDIYSTNCGVDAQIIENEGLGKQLVKVRWLDEYGYESVVNTSNLSQGRISTPYAKSVNGIGYIGVGVYAGTKDGERTLEYDKWKSVFSRCYSDKYISGKPTYGGCFVGSDWHCLQDFGAWVNNQVGWKLPDWQIDKDLLVKGNKEYGPDYCTFLPRKLNMLIVTRVGGRGDYPIGVHQDMKRNQVTAQFKEFDGTRKLKRFWTVDEAFQFYKTNKERVVKEAAEIYKGQIDPRAYDALMSWEISIND